MAAVAQAPTEGNVLLAGKQEANIRDEWRTVHFYHRVTLTQNSPELKQGDVILARCQVSPAPESNGRVQLLGHDIQKLGQTTQRDSHQNALLEDAVNLAHAQGQIAAPPRLQTFEDGREVLNFSLIVGQECGLLEVCAYGPTASLFAQAQAGENVLIAGRLVNEKRQSSKGARTYTKLEMWRQSILDG